MQLNSKTQKEKKTFNGIALTTLGWELALPIFGGALLGFQIDRNIIGSSYKFTLLLIAAGIIIGYYNIYKYIQIELLRTKLAKMIQKEKSSNK